MVTEAAKPMRFLLTSIGSCGDVFPLVGIAGELVKRGHDVSMVTNHRYADMVKESGAAYLSPGEEGDNIAEILGQFDILHSHRSASLLLKTMMLDTVRPVYRALEKAAVPGKTVLVSFATVPAARLVSERLSIPHVTVCLAPGVFRSVEDPPRFNAGGELAKMPRWLLRLVFLLVEFFIDFHMRKPLNRFRREIHLKPIRWVLRWLDSSNLLLELYPPWFGAPPSDIPAHIELTCFPMFDGKKTQPLGEDLRAFLESGDPPLVFTAGTPAGQADWFHRESARACEILGRRGILLTQFTEDVPAELPDGVIHVGFAPFSELLPHVAAFVHHAGIGTVSQALAAGVPQLVVPWGVDQYDNAQRVTRLGVGIEQDVHQYTGEAVAEKLRHLVEDEQIAAKCVEIASKFGEGSLGQICERLEIFAGESLAD